jgi:hypothetical protein
MASLFPDQQCTSGRGAADKRGKMLVPSAGPSVPMKTHSVKSFLAQTSALQAMGASIQD